MPPKKIHNPEKKDSNKLLLPPSRSSTRLASKMQKNEQEPRLTQDNIQTNRPGSGKSFKDAVLSSNNQFQILQATTSQESTNLERISVKTRLIKASSASSMGPRTLSSRSKSPGTRSANAITQSMYKQDAFDNQEGKWITVTKSRKSNPRSSIKAKSSNNVSTNIIQTRTNDAASTTSSTKQELAEVKEEVRDIKNNMDTLMEYFKSVSMNQRRPASIISVKSSRSRITDSAAKDKLNEFEAIDDHEEDQEKDSVDESIVDNEIESKFEDIEQQFEDIETSSAIQRRLLAKATSFPPKNVMLDRYMRKEEEHKIDNDVENVEYAVEYKRPVKVEYPKSTQHEPSREIPREYYCKNDRDILEEQDLAQEKEYRKYWKSKRNKKRSSKRKPKHHYSSESDSSDSDNKPLFASNKFSIVVKEGGKIKYNDMITFLKTKRIENDSPYQVQKVYEGVVRSITFAFQTHIDVMPSFRQLEKTTSFEDVFLGNLIGSTLDKSRAVYDRLGEIIKDVLTSTTTISQATSPIIYRIIDTHKLTDGWNILEKIIQGRVPFCGAKPDTDLDIELAHLTFEKQESIHQFYAKTERLTNKYKLQYRFDQEVPHTKITVRFIQEIMRVPEYVPYILPQYNNIMKGIKNFPLEKLPYTVGQLYSVLDDANVSEIPSIMNESTLERHQQKISREISQQNKSEVSSQEFVGDNEIRSLVALYEMQPILHPIIAAVESQEPLPTCFTPQICAMNKPRKRCHACLLGFHEEVNCYLRGQLFMPEELRQRINRYNATHGTGPPKNHKPPEYKPSSVAAEFAKKNNNNNNSTERKSRFKRPAPFANNKTKQASVNCIESTIDEDDGLERDDGNNQAVIAAFISDQVKEVEDNSEFYYLNNNEEESVMCVVENSYERSNSAREMGELVDLIENIDYSTPPDLLQVIGDFHRGNSNQPNRHFLLQHAMKISKLPNNIFRKYDIRNFQIDSGANVSSIKDRSLFYFYINNQVTAEIAGGGNLSSPGWGGILIMIGNKVHLLSPVHYVPGSPRNIMSTGALITFTGFKEVNHKMYKSLSMIDNVGKQIQWELETRNYLNFRDIQIMSFDHRLYDMTRSQPQLAPAKTYDAPLEPRITKVERLLQDININEIPELEQISDERKCTEDIPLIQLANGRTKRKSILEMPKLSTTEISHIASYYINLYPSVSPRANAINTMNKLLGEVNTTLPQGLPIIFTTPEIIEWNESEYDDSVIQPIVNSKLSRTVSRKSTNNLQEYFHLHLSCMHASMSTLRQMIKNKLLKDLPDIEDEIEQYDCTCQFCLMAKSNKLSRGKLVDYSKMKPFQQLHIDFAIYNHTSLRGMTSALGVVCASTTFPFGFPTKNRNPPLEIVRYLVETIRAMGFEVNFIRVDEDGALAKSAEFCRTVVQLNCVLQTTSGGNSENNGKVERAHRTQANMVRASLSTIEVMIRDEQDKAEIDIRDFWCFAYSHAIHTQRRLYSSAIKDIPYFAIHKKRPSAKELVPFGSIITVINPSKDKLPKLARNRAMKGYFLGFGNHVRSILYWDPKHPRTYKRTYHAVVEDTVTITKLQDEFTSPMQKDNNSQQNHLQLYREFDLNSGPFPKEKIMQVKIPLPMIGVPLGLEIRDDTLYNMPYLWRVRKESPVKEYIPAKLRRNHFILHINNNSPITSKFVVEHIQHLRDTGAKEIIMDLAHRGTGDTSSSLEISRAIFDQIPSVYIGKPIINSLNSVIPETHEHFVRSASKPIKPRFFHECLRSPIRNNWIAAAKVAFEKNHRIAVFSLPFLKSELPSEERVFGTVLVPEVKQTDVPGVWELRIRECIIGTAQKKALDFEESYSPTINETTVKLQIGICAALQYTIAIIDVKNAFQNTISKNERRIFVSVPPTYLEWLSKYDRKFSFKKGETYVRQMLNANQGTKDAGNQWYALLCWVLRKFGMVRSTVDHGFFVRDFGKDGKLYVSLATDDLLCGYLKQQVFDEFVLFLKQYFTIVVQMGKVLKFLGIRIIQSNEAISMDQAQYIYDMCVAYFGKDHKNIRTVSIPMWSDAELEKELFDSPPLSKEELLQATLRFKGGYRHHIGKLNFAVATRFDIQYAVQRLAEYSCEPTLAAFEAIDRIYRYLAQDILRPLVFPRRNLRESSSITITLSPDQNATIELSNEPTLFTDAELGRDLQTQRSYYCVIVTLLGVVILCKIKKSPTIMIHTTDSEAQASYDGVRRIQPIRALCEFMGYPLNNPTTHFVDNSAVHQIITSERMTPRCRHFDLPIAFLHEQVNKSFSSQLIKTWLQLGDIGTKPLVRALHKRFKYWGSGVRFLPPKGSEHYENLEMEYYEVKFSDIISLYEEENET